MSRFSLALSLLPVLFVPAALSAGLSHQSRSLTGTEIPVMYQAPSPMTDPIHVRELTRLRAEIDACEHSSGHLPHRLHPNLTAEYRLIIRETTPEAIRRAGLPFEVH